MLLAQASLQQDDTQLHDALFKERGEVRDEGEDGCVGRSNAKGHRVGHLQHHLTLPDRA